MAALPKRKVLYVITKSNWGGAQRYVYDLGTALPKDEFEAVVAAPEGPLAEKLRAAGIRTVPIAFAQKRNFFFTLFTFGSLFSLIALLRRERPHVLHVQSAKAGGLGALAGRIVGTPKIIFTAHGWSFLEDRNAIVKCLIYFFSWLTALLSHTVITISDHDLAIAKRMPGVGRKVVRIYNGIAPIEFLPREPHEGVRILTNAELTRNKNLFLAIDAVAEAKNAGAAITYSIMSTGELREALLQYVKDKHLEEVVSFLGFVPEGSRQYRNYDIFLLSSKKEGVPYVILEAGLAELPVVASNVGGIPEIIEHGRSGFLVDPSDTAIFAAFLVRLAQSSEERNRLGAALKEKVGKTFSLSRMIEETVPLYRN